MQELIKKYFGTFLDKNGQKYGVRIADSSDAQKIVGLFTEIYNETYVEPAVLDVTLLNKKLSDPRDFWFVGEQIFKFSSEIVGAGLVRRIDQHTLTAAKAVIGKKYQGKGIGNVLGTKGIITALSLPRFQGTIKLIADARAFNIYPQKVLEKAGAFPFGFNPAYVNFGVRNWQAIDNDHPFLKGSVEPIVYYMRPLNGFWRRRENKVYLISNEHVLSFYYHLKSSNSRMKKDDLTITSGDRIGWQDSEIALHPELGAVFIKGCLHNTFLKHYLYKYSHWRYIEWRIPATEKGLDSMKAAIDNGFKVIGYDIGSLYSLNGSIVDCVIFGKFFKPIRKIKLKHVELTFKGQELANKMISQL